MSVSNESLCETKLVAKNVKMTLVRVPRPKYRVARQLMPS